MKSLPLLPLLLFCLSAYGQSQKLRIESLDLEKSVIVLGCSPGWAPATDRCNDSPEVRVSVKISGGSAGFNMTVGGGQVVERSSDGFRWDLAGVPPGSYTVTVYAIAADGRASEGKTSIVTVKKCEQCGRGDSCPVVELIAPQRLVQPGESFEVEAKVAGAADATTYSWTLSAGTISSGQGTRKITIDTTGVPGGSSLIASIDLQVPTGFPACQTNFSEAISIAELPQPTLVDEFPTVSTSCEDGNARLDSYFTELNNNPADRGVIVIYDSPLRRRAAWHREQLFGNFIKFRRFDRSRIEFVRGPYRAEAKVQFWRVPPGARDPEVLDGNVNALPTETAPRPRPVKPYEYATRYVEGLPECEVPMFDLAEYAKVLNMEPRSRGRVVIGEPTRTEFAKEQRRIAAELAANGVTRSRLLFVYKYVRPNRALETIELWVLPSTRAK